MYGVLETRLRAMDFSRASKIRSSLQGDLINRYQKYHELTPDGWKVVWTTSGDVAAHKARYYAIAQKCLDKCGWAIWVS